VVREGVRSLATDATPAAAYGTFAFPVHLLSGEKSPLPARRVVARLSASIPGAWSTTVLGAGHLAPLTHADAVNVAILDGLATAASTSRSIS
jgi:pimeloyl-ACP methyl ester carboxylesterase